MLMMQDALPKLKQFIRSLKLNAAREMLAIRIMMAFILHRGRMSASRAGEAVRTDPRHRAQICRFVSRKFWESAKFLDALRKSLLVLSAPPGTFILDIDQTYCSQQGKCRRNTLRMGRKSARKGKKKSGYALSRKQCHCFVMGLLITPQGIRIPFCKSFYTREYCQQTGRPYRRQTELAADIIRELPVPFGADVMVLGDTAFDAKPIREACTERGYHWIVPLNPERVLAGPKPRPKVSSLVSEFSADQFQPVRLHPGTGEFAAQRRASRYRVGPKAKSRTFYVHEERREVRSVGPVRLVFSTRTRPHSGQTVDVQKILMTNHKSLSVAQIVELYDLRWQIELFFKELKSTLGMHQYRFAKFEAVERWVEFALATFMYLEWYRAKQLARRDLTRQQRRWWERQRTYGLCQAARQIAETRELKLLAKHLETPRGIRKLARMLQKSYASEYRLPL